MGHDPSEEVTPLLVAPAPVPAGYAAPPTPAPYPYPPPPAGVYPPPGYAPNYATGPPPASSFPPVYQQQPQMMQVPNAEGNFEVSCRVCSHPIQKRYSAAKKMSAVKCTQCNHATQVGPPPTGKNFILCQCNTLLTVPITAKAATCPKADCKRTLILAPEDPGKNRAFCAHCSTLLTYRSTSAVVICPKCRGRSVVSRAKLHGYIGFSVLIGILFIFLCLFFTLSTYEASGGTYYFVFWGVGVAGVLALVRAVVYTVLNWRAKDASIVPV